MVAKAEMIPIRSLMGKLRWLFSTGPQGCTKVKGQGLRSTHAEKKEKDTVANAARQDEGE